ncbi:MAG: hypothetical protein UR26_C0001G0004 [candidate division TM6 bacterium GW2011_GWF2_32_72]|nr:MAG: hypothetical protein UR26_C0001G0004 [candidate division TM6 bacterium GW2011_GWF2_32_72]
MVLNLINWIGVFGLSLCDILGDFFLFLIKAIKSLVFKKLKVQKVFNQIERIGVNSLPIVILTGAFTGMVLAIQLYNAFKRIGGVQYIGSTIAFSLVRELGPVLTGLMVTGRAGSAMTAEIGTMRITEQIDALKTLCLDPFQYLVVPRILAGAIILPLLSLFSSICGIIGGYLICTYVLGLNPEDYINSIRDFLELKDITNGLIKAVVFGIILTWVGTYKGYYTRGGAKGVGEATTQSVVLSSISILILDYFLTKALESGNF